MHHLSSQHRFRVLVSLASSLSLGLGGNIVAAEPQTQPSADILQEVVVTAQRVEQRLQDTPIAITAFLASDIEKLNIRNVGDAAAFTPNFMSNPGPTGGNDAFYFIRGVGQTDLNPATDPGVATYVDGVYLGRVMGASIDSNDVQRIEVLRGPQGTLFGRNTIGGAVSITTLDPAKVLGGEVDVIGGSRNLREVRAAIDLPITDNQGLRLSGDWREQDGWGKRASDGTIFDTNHLASGNAKYKWTPTDNLSLTLAGDASKLTGTSQHTILVGFNTVAPGGGPLFSPLGVPFPSGIANYLSPPNPYVNNSSVNPRKDDTNSGASLTLDWNLGFAKLQSISAYRQLKQNVSTDYDSTPYSFYEGGFVDKQHQWSEELHLSGDTGPAKWLLGAFYFKEHNANVNVVSLGGNNGCLPFPVGAPPGNPFYFVYPVCNFAGGQAYATPGVDRRIVNNQAFTLDTKAEALFGQTTIKFADQWSATLGVRWTQETKQQDYNFFIDNSAGVANLAGLPPAILYTLSPNNPFNTAPTNYNKTWSSVTPKVGIEYQPDQNFLYYASYAKGFKSGGFNGRPNPGTNGTFGGITPYDPEKIDTYELGAKTQFAENRVRINAAVFQSNYKGIQLLAVDLSTPGVTGFFNTLNAAESRIRGAEIEFQAVPFAALQIDAGLGYTKDQYLSLTRGVQASGIEYGMDLPLTPRVNGSAGVQYSWNIAAGKLTVRSDYNFRTQFWFEADNTPINRQGGYGLINGRATYELPGGHWSFAAYGLNLTNKFYHTNAQDVTAALGVAFASVSPPREWGGELHYRFGIDQITSKANAPHEAADVVIVGAGAAGGVYADRLSRAGKRVVVLEAGINKTLGDMYSSSIWARRHKWSGAPVMLEGANPIAHNVSTGSGLGGAAYHHYATWPRFPVDVFELRSRHGRGFDWGISYSQLQPWYDRVQADVGIAGDASAEPWRGPGAAYPMLPLRTFAHGDLLARGFNRLGLPVSPMPAAINSEVFKGRSACLYDGWCDAGCPIGALANPLVTYLGWAQQRGVLIKTGAAVSRVLTDKRGRARGVEYFSDGVRHQQHAQLVILAASFIQNPRILLCSGNSPRPGGGVNPGLANSSGMLGKYLLSDAMCFAYGLFDEHTEIHRGVNSGQYYHHSAFRDSSRVDLFGAYQWQIAPAAKPNDIFGVACTRPELYGEPLHAFLREATEHLAYMVGFAGGASRESNRVELDSQRRDLNGLPLARAVYQHDPETVRLARHVNEQGLTVMQAAGARSQWNGPLAGGHISGGTLMGATAAHSVCDTYGRTHDVRNLILAGAGVFPQSGGTSPTFTLHALALRSAEQIASHWGDYT